MRTDETAPLFLPSGRQPARLVESSANLEETRVVLIAPARCLGAAPLGLATKLLLADEGERGAELFVLDNRGLRDLANLGSPDDLFKTAR
jgi:hypothetical protein